MEYHRATVADAPALRMNEGADEGTSAAILGFPQNGGYDVQPGRLGHTATAVTQDAYGRGPVEDPQFYTDGLHLKMGRTAPLPSFLPAFDGYDLPRDPQQPTALIPDPRNDENLVVAQTHLAFIRFHNRVADTIAPGPTATKFEAAREQVVKHYQWMLRHDYLPRIVDPGFVEFLDAQRAYNETVQTYNDARAEFARALYTIDAATGANVIDRKGPQP